MLIAMYIVRDVIGIGIGLAAGPGLAKPLFLNILL